MTLTSARRQWKKRQRQYVVGYIRSGNTLYGRKAKPNPYCCTDPMTLREARYRLSEMPSSGCAIFRLTPIALGGGKA